MTRELRFAEIAPKSGRLRSMIVFLHGYGADGADLLSLGEALAEDFPDTLFVAPDAPERPAGLPMGYQWFPIPRFDGTSEAEADAGLTRARADLDAFLDARLAAARLDSAQLAVIGFSQGSMLALHVLPRRREPVAAVVAFSGRVLHAELMAAEARARPPVLLLHGDRDEVVPFGHMAEAGQALDAAGFAVEGFVMRGGGHGISPEGLAAGRAFLLKHLKAATTA